MLKTFFFLFFASICFATSDPVDLARFEASLYSQNGEDGILQKIFQLIKPSSLFCVDLGAADGVTGSKTYLLRLQGWEALLLDRNYESSPHDLYKEFITAQNINEIFEKYNVPTSIDLLSIDLGYNDFYVWKALDPKYKPAVVVIGYNATHLPSEDKVVKYHPFFCGDATQYFGASILALYHLGLSKGYSLVYAEKNGTNLFFVRTDLIEKNNLAFMHGNDVEKLYRPRLDQPRGSDQRNRPYLTSKNLLQPTIR